MRIILSMLTVAAAATAMPALAVNNFITRIDIAGHGIVNGGAGADRPPNGTTNAFYITIDFPGPYRVPMFVDGAHEFTTYPGSPAYGRPFSLSIGDTIRGAEPTTNSYVNVFVAGGAVTALGVDARSFRPQGGIDTNQSFHASWPYAYYYGEFRSPSGTNFYTMNAVIDRFDVTVANVPEPASWSLLIAGFGLTGAALRRRRSFPALANVVKPG
jgi:hypothetical protein